MNRELQHIMTKISQKKRSLLIGTIIFLLSVRLGEYALDVFWGNGDGYMTNPLPALGLTIINTAGFLIVLSLVIPIFKLEQRPRWVHLGIIIVISLMIWLSFYPAIMSPDSIEQYRQARSQTFHDWHPPLMAIILSGIMKHGGDIQHLMLLQCLLGSMGVYFLTRNVFKSPKIPPRSASCFAMMLFCILVYPITPLATYLIIFWKDAWCAILLLWILAIALTLYQYGRTFSSVRFYSLYSMFIFVAVTTLLTRHNAIVMLPFLCALSWLILSQTRRLSWLHALGISLSLLIAYGISYTGQYQLFQIKQQHAGQQVIALDLVGMLVHNPALHDEFPYITSHLAENYAEKYKYGDIVPLYSSILAPSYFSNSEALRGEYRHAVLNFPAGWLYVKLRAFYELIRPSRIHYWFLMNISENTFELSPNTLFHPVREALRTRLLTVWHSPILRMFSGIHLVWIAINLGMTGACIRDYCRERRTESLLWLSILSMILAYYASYLLATTAWDFRFMYPATLSMQVLTLSCLFKWFYMKTRAASQ